MNIVVDSYAWIEIFLGSSNGMKAKQLMLEADEVRTPDIVLAEISRKYSREKVDRNTIRSRLDTIGSATLVTEIDARLALQAGTAYLELAAKAQREHLRSPSLFDAVVLATAREYDSKVITGDEHFEALPETIFLQ